MMIRRKTTALGILMGLALILAFAAGCGGDSSEEAPASGTQSPTGQADNEGVAKEGPADRVAVVTTSNIVADWVRAVGQERVDVFPLLPANADPHTFQPGAQDITRVAEANLVFSVGLSLEGGWLDELITNAASDPGIVVPLGKAIDPIDLVAIVEDQHEEGEAEGDREEEVSEEGEHHGGLDPHFWFDPLRVNQAVGAIADRLSTADPAGESLYRENATNYNGELDDLHAWIEQQVGSIAEDQRVLVTSHDSFHYLARRYGFEVAGAIFPVSTEAEPTAQDLAELIETIEHEGVSAVFTERSNSERLAQRVAEETGAVLIGGLYTGSLGEPGGEAGTYLDLMRHNTTIIVEALR